MYESRVIVPDVLTALSMLVVARAAENGPSVISRVSFDKHLPREFSSYYVSTFTHCFAQVIATKMTLVCTFRRMHLAQSAFWDANYACDAFCHSLFASITNRPKYDRAAQSSSTHCAVQQLVQLDPCLCTEADYECDIGFERIDSGECIFREV